jgi:hypothetical protein
VGTAAAAGSVSLDAADVGAGRAVSNAVLTGPGTAEGDMSGGYGGSGSAATYEATATFDFSTSETLDLELLTFVADSAGIAFDSMELLVVHGTTQIEKTFSSLAGAEAFFVADPIISLGAVALGQSIEIEYMLGYNSDTSAAPGAGFGFTYDLVDPAVTPAIPEPSTWAMLIMGFVGLGLLLLLGNSCCRQRVGRDADQELRSVCSDRRRPALLRPVGAGWLLYHLDDLSVGTHILQFQGETGAGFSLSVTDTLNVVPEPSTWTMMLVGFTGLSFAACRNRRTQRAACHLPA